MRERKREKCEGLSLEAAEVVQWVKAFAPQAEGWVFESQPRQTQVVRTGSESSTAKRQKIGVSIKGP